MLTGLWHWAISRSNNQDRAVHLRSTGDHVFHIVGVAWAVNVSVVTCSSLILNVCGVDGDTAGFFFRRAVDLIKCTSLAAVGFSQYGSDSCSQGGFTVVNVTDGAHVYVQFVTLKLLFSHR